MAGKTDQTKLQFLFKKVLGKANTSNIKQDYQETLGSAVQLSGKQVLADFIPTAPTQTVNVVSNYSAEYLILTATAVPGSTYDANDTGGGGDGSQSAGPHSYYFHLSRQYQQNSTNQHRGLGLFTDGMALSASNGALQMIPPVYSNASPNPYQIEVFEDDGSGGLGDQIQLTDETDWYVDYYNGILFLQDYDATKIPKYVRGFMYVGSMEDQYTNPVTVSGSYGVANGTSKYMVMSGSRAGGDLNHSKNSGNYVGNPLAYTDTSFYVSGSKQARGGTGLGVAVMGGDTIVSGALYVGGHDTGTGWGTTEAHIASLQDPNSKIRFYGAGYDFLGGTGGSSYPNGEYAFFSIATSGAKTVTVNVLQEDIDFIVQGDTGKLIKADAGNQLLELGSVAAGEYGTDVSLFVSGADSGTGAAAGKRTKGVSVFNGDVVLSGGLYLGSRIYNEGDHNSYIRPRPDNWEFVAGGTTLLKLDKTENTVSINTDNNAISTVIQGANKQGVAVDGSIDRVLVLSGGAVTSNNEAAGIDVSFYVSGSTTSKTSYGTSDRGLALFGGDVLISGTLYDSSGNAISSGGSPGGSDTQIQFNNSNAFAGSSNLIWDGTKVAISNTATTDSFLITTTEASADAGPVVSLKRVSGSPSSGDYLGQIKFKANNDGSAETVFAKITGKAPVVTNTSEDGQIEFAVMAAGTQTIVSRIHKSGLTALTHLNLGLGQGDSGYGIRSNAGTVEWKNNGGSWAAFSSGGGSGGGTAGWIAAANQIISTTGSVYIGTANASNPDINLGVDGAAVFNEQGSSVDFRVESNTKTHAVFVDGSTDQVLILSGGAVASINEASASDVNFYVSGSAGNKSLRGTAVFGGDVFASGSLSSGLASTLTDSITINSTTGSAISTHKVGVTTVSLNGGASPTAKNIDQYSITDSMAVKYFISLTPVTAGVSNGDRAVVEILISNDGTINSTHSPVFTENRAHTDYNVSNSKAGYLDAIYLPLVITQTSNVCTVAIKGSTYWLSGTGSASAHDLKIRFERTVIRT